MFLQLETERGAMLLANVDHISHIWKQADDTATIIIGGREQNLTIKYDDLAKVLDIAQQARQI